MSTSKLPCPRCGAFANLFCGPCAAKRDAEKASSAAPSQTDKQVCALRELVLAHAAHIRAAREFEEAIGVLDCDQESIIADWLDDSAPADAREVDADTLADVLRAIGDESAVRASGWAASDRGRVTYFNTQQQARDHLESVARNIADSGSLSSRRQRLYLELADRINLQISEFEFECEGYSFNVKKV